MITISVNYTLKWRFKNYHYLQITACKKIINIKTMRIKKKCVNGGLIGYWLTPKLFAPIKTLNILIEPIPKKTYCPF